MIPYVQVVDSSKVVVTIPCGDSIEANEVAAKISAAISRNEFEYHKRPEDAPVEHVEEAKAYPEAEEDHKLKPEDFDLLPKSE